MRVFCCFGAHRVYVVKNEARVYRVYVCIWRRPGRYIDELQWRVLNEWVWVYIYIYMAIEPAGGIERAAAGREGSDSDRKTAWS